MNYFGKSGLPKGESNIYFILLAVLLTVCVIFSFKYYHDKNNGAVIQLPKVDVH
jgi:hypothetical protein